MPRETLGPLAGGSAAAFTLAEGAETADAIAGSAQGGLEGRGGVHQIAELEHGSLGPFPGGGEPEASRRVTPRLLARFGELTPHTRDGDEPAGVLPFALGGCVQHAQDAEQISDRLERERRVAKSTHEEQDGAGGKTPVGRNRLF